jgi:hypothetical protein
MAVLTARARKAIPTSKFALPGARKYPIHDRAHAANALSRVSQFGSPAQKATVRAAVKKRFPGMGKSNPGNPGTPAMPKTPAMMPKRPMMGQTARLSAMMGK